MVVRRTNFTALFDLPQIRITRYDLHPALTAASMTKFKSLLLHVSCKWRIRPMNTKM
ncbi:hypothetical protein Z949_399 [Sulfitobacter guttiformis KCTC 32187]|nr:hypothetical protein Z949_399 [Sulfitobacter guttiformis KCTC 32187]